jgi:hypothetical protein
MSTKVMRTILGTAMITAALFSVATQRARAQAYPGDNAVWSSSTAKTHSHSFIDASVVTGTSGNTDICARINAALLNLANATTYPGYGTAALIDARAIPVGTSIPCSMSPWGGTAPAAWPGATILLPAGTIAITTPWTLPSGTRLIGQGIGSGGISTTTIQAETGFSSSSSMIQMGSTATAWCPSTGCVAISVEDLTLDGNSKAPAGITNSQAQDFSYIRRVNFYQISGTALQISGNAVNSGPYNDLSCTPGSAAGSSTFCAQILNVATHGVHGMTCTGPSTPTTTPAILLDAPGNSLEDIHVQGFGVGVAIGTNSGVTNGAQGDVLVNITGGTGVATLIHISSTKPPSDLSLMGVNSNGSTTTIQDDLTTSTITDASIALYALGESFTSGTHTVYSRFTTSKSQPTWGVGSSVPSSCSNGSMFSSTSTSTTHWLYVCRSGTFVGL